MLDGSPSHSFIAHLYVLSLGQALVNIENQCNILIHYCTEASKFGALSCCPSSFLLFLSTNNGRTFSGSVQVILMNVY